MALSPLELCRFLSDPALKRSVELDHRRLLHQPARKPMDCLAYPGNGPLCPRPLLQPKWRYDDRLPGGDRVLRCQCQWDGDRDEYALAISNLHEYTHGHQHTNRDEHSSPDGDCRAD